MKRTALFFAAAVLAAPAFADDLCTVNLQKLDDSLTTSTVGSPLKEQVEEAHQAALKAQSAGDLQACGTHAEKALQMLERPSTDGSSSS
ncbi:hypothetical protein SAMN05216600_11522 [Pseudomonas cuatrocienegasensis]|jgi:hypothetical protein|uniref:Secreted protein n=1 Tax=Pseudomonas cuatrocienegasensis TaxID=543360 RepID=A0ABY1BL84_9PSED|nr:MULTISPECIES: hypothetical protein [Pseudomonas]OEC34376.1 hypothetical protein A7D25_14325 [Pseudomonas sp. 21C1]SER09743.1 hypothetical protein SAMN05216600_11522 [Pseudomonas cuatrocienegasensis]